MWRRSTPQGAEHATTSICRAHKLPRCGVSLAAVVGTAIVLSLATAPLLNHVGVGATPAQASELTDAQQQLEEARAQLKAKQAELDELAARHEEALCRLEATQDRTAEVEAELQRTHEDFGTIKSQLNERVRRAYMNRGTPSVVMLESLFSSETDLGTVLNRFSLLTRVVRQDEQVFEQVNRHLAKLDELQAELQQKRAEQEQAVAELEAENTRAQQVLEAAASDYNTLKKRVQTLEEEERIRKEQEAKAAAAAAQAGSSGGGGGSGRVITGNWCFPVDGPNSFIDTWGAPRSNGRTHKGTDVMCARGTPLLAVVGGSIWNTTPTDVGAGGIGLWIAGDDGNYYYYCHLDSIGAGIVPGVRVRMGQVVGYAGNTGNAAGGAVHLHFEIHPGNGAAVNPYPTLAAHR